MLHWKYIMQFASIYFCKPFDSGRWLEMIILYCWLKIIMLYCGRCSDQLCTDDFGGLVLAKVFHKSLIGGKINIPFFFFVKSSSFEESLVPDCQTVKPVLVEVIQNVKELLLGYPPQPAGQCQCIGRMSSETKPPSRISTPHCNPVLRTYFSSNSSAVIERNEHSIWRNFDLFYKNCVKPFLKEACT